MRYQLVALLMVSVVLSAQSSPGPERTPAQPAMAPGAQSVSFPGVRLRIHAGENKPVLIEKKGELTFDDAGKKLLFQAGDHSFEATYDTVRRVVFDESTHMRGGLGQGIGGIVGALMSSKRISDYWMYIESAGLRGSGTKHMLEIPRESSSQVQDKAKQLFGDRVGVTEVRIGTPIDKKTLKDIDSKHTFKMDRKNRPVLEPRPDKALVVVVCPLVAGKSAGGLQVKVHANDRVILVNQNGSYGFVHLDPGDYQLFSQSVRASALEVKLEAGKGYYFLQDSFSSAGGLTQLSQHSEELVMLELSGSSYGRWERKPEK